MAQEWEDNLAFWGLDEKGRRATKLKCLEACITCNHELANVLRKCIEERCGHEENDSERPQGPQRGPRTASRPVG
eukprot:1937806-Rhodomonas_salina.1